MPFASTCRRRRRGCGGARLAALLLGALALVPAGPSAPVRDQPAPPPPPVFRSQTDLVVLQVSVVDGQQRFVPGLQLEDFAVYEEGARQQVMLFAATSMPLDVTL